MKHDQIRFIFQDSHLYNPLIALISVAVVGSHSSKKSSTVDMTSSHELFSPLLYLLSKAEYFNHIKLHNNLKTQETYDLSLLPHPHGDTCVL